MKRRLCSSVSAMALGRALPERRTTRSPSGRWSVETAYGTSASITDDGILTITGFGSQLP